MPHADLYYTADQSLAVAPLLAEIEALVLAYDAGAGQTKGRGHRIAEYHHSHIHMQYSMLPKAHRTAEWARELGALLADKIKAHAKKGSDVTINIAFDLQHYTAVKA